MRPGRLPPPLCERWQRAGDRDSVSGPMSGALPAHPVPGGAGFANLPVGGFRAMSVSHCSMHIPQGTVYCCVLLTNAVFCEKKTQLC